MGRIIFSTGFGKTSKLIRRIYWRCWFLDQDTAKSSPNSTQSPEVTSKELEDGNDVKVKVLSERLSSVVLDIRAKDDLVKQHSKVAEEAVLGTVPLIYTNRMNQWWFAVSSEK
jgi:hypothetical protein